jgi:hypothetical protein
MARSETYTWLPLDEWAKIMGYNRWEFNGFAKWPSDQRSCGNVWFQHPEMTDFVTKDELSESIKLAETVIGEYVGYNLLPTWDSAEVQPPRFRVPGYQSNVNVFNRAKSVKLPKAHVYALGQETKAVITAGVAVVRVDRDGDGFAETATVTTTLTDINVNEIRVYYPGESGADGWEIRPIKITGNVIEFPVWLIPKRNLIDGLNPIDLDPSNTANYLTTVDVYRVYNDTTTQATLVYNQGLCVEDGCAYETASNCGYVQNGELGYVVYNRYGYREPDQLWINYYSGWRGNNVRPLVTLDPYWASAVAYLAVSLLDKPLHNVAGGIESQLPSRWQEMLGERNTTKSYAVSQFMAENPFGILTQGAWFAYQRAVARRL